MFYHGSSTPDLKILKPQLRFTPEGGEYKELVYLTPNKGYACCHAFPWSSEEGFDLDMNDETRELFFKVPKEFEQRLQAQISVYLLPGDKYREMESTVFTKLDYVSDKEIEVVKEIKYKSVRDALIKNMVRLEII